MELVLALTGLYDGGATCSLDPTLSTSATDAHDWRPQVRSMARQWGAVLRMNAPAEVLAGEEAARTCRHPLALAVGLDGRLLPPSSGGGGSSGRLLASSAPVLPPEWTGPVLASDGAKDKYQAWRAEPLRQAFGKAPTHGEPDYSYEVESGVVLCELLSQNAFHFTHSAKAALETAAWERGTSVAAHLEASCHSPEGASQLLGLVLRANQAPAPHGEL